MVLLLVSDLYIMLVGYWRSSYSKSLASLQEGFLNFEHIIDSLWVDDNLLPDHVGLTYGLDLTVHLVHLSTLMGRALSQNPSFFSFLGT